MHCISSTVEWRIVVKLTIAYLRYTFIYLTFHKSFGYYDTFYSDLRIGLNLIVYQCA
jgi:hypothetical protein